MNFLPLPVPLFFILQLFVSVVWSQGASSTASPSSSTSTSTTGGSTTQSTTATGTTNSTASSTGASTTSTAQFPSLSGVSTCVSNCLAEASANLGCASVVDVNCFCVKSDYPTQLLDCVFGNCPDQVSVIETLGQEFCNVASGQPTLSYFSVPATTTTTASSTSPSSLTTTTSTTSGSPTSSATTTSSAAISWKFISGSTDLIRLGAIMVLGVVLGV